MSKNYKTSFMFYSAWNYQKEVEDLNRESEKGWQLVKGGCFHSRFVKNPDIQYRYQLDFRQVEDMGRYIEMFREQGWEYVSSTFNGWHYFRKLYDPSLPEEAYEIFTDRESLQEMNSRWARIALGIGIALALFGILSAVRMITAPELPRLVQMLTFFVESAVLLRGSLIMRNPDASRSRRGDSALLGIFFAVILLGAAGGIILQDMRPNLSTEQQEDTLSEPLTDNRWADFKVRYTDNYYLDLEFESDGPLTFAVINEADEAVYTETGTSFSKENIRIRLSKGQYSFSMSCETGFHLKCSID